MVGAAGDLYIGLEQNIIVNLLGLHLSLLQGQDVRLLYLNEVQKTLGETGSKAIHIP